MFKILGRVEALTPSGAAKGEAMTGAKRRGAAVSRAEAAIATPSSSKFAWREGSYLPAAVDKSILGWLGVAIAVDAR